MAPKAGGEGTALIEQRPSVRARQAGDRVGDYRLVAPLTPGEARHTVWRAHDDHLDRLVIMKHHTGDPERVVAEGRRLARLRHPGVVEVLAVVPAADGPWLALALVDGEDLREHLRRGLRRQDALSWLVQIADAVALVHGQGLLHLDLKPENVVINAQGRPVLIDFDIAARAGEAGGGGTRGYMAPEQLGADHLTAAADVWALGVLIHELLTGERPEPPRVDARRLGSPALAELLPRCWATDPARRPAAREVQQTLEAARDAVASPFGVLTPLTEAHAGLLVGREAHLAACLALLESQDCVVISGGSGTGKSSFLHAGLVPRLRAAGALVVALEPAADPWAALLRAARQVELRAAEGDDEVTWQPHTPAAATRAAQVRALVGEGTAARGPDTAALLARCAADWHARTGRRVVIAVDQLEIVFALSLSLADQTGWLAALEGLAGRGVAVVVLLRQDFEERIKTPRLRAAIGGAARVVLWDPDAQSLPGLIEGLAAAARLALAPGLVAALAAELADQAHVLPLLQVVARGLADLGRAHLVEADLAHIGGVAGAIERHADRVVERHAGPALDRILLALVAADGGALTRRGCARAELVALGGEDLVRVLEDGHLIVPPPALPDERRLVHECLIGRWSRLQRLLEDDRTIRGQVLALEAAAERWDAGGRKHLPDRRLLQAWRGLPRAELRARSPAGQALMRAAARRIWYLGGGVAIALVAVGVVAWLGWSSSIARQRAVEETERAVEEQRRARLASIRAHVSLALRVDDLADARQTMSVLLRESKDAATRALLDRLNSAQHRLHIPIPGWIHEARFSPDGRWVAVAPNDERPILADLRSGHIQPLEGNASHGRAVAFSPDSRWLATGDHEGGVVVRAVDGRCRVKAPAVPKSLNSLAFQDDGVLVVVHQEGILRRLAVGDCALAELPVDEAPAGTYAARPGPTGLIAATLTGGVFEQAAPGGPWRSISPAVDLSTPGRGLSVDQSGLWAAITRNAALVGGPDRPGEERGLSGLFRLASTAGGALTLLSVAPSPGSFWHVGEADPPPRLVLHTGRPVDVDPGRRLLLTADDTRGVDVWSADFLPETPTAERAPTWITLCATDGRVFAAGPYGQFGAWSLGDGRRLPTGAIGPTNGQLACHPGRPLLMAAPEDIYRLADLAPGRSRKRGFHRGAFLGLAWAPRGDWLVGFDERAKHLEIMDAAGRTLRTTAGPALSEVRELAVSADGAWIAAVERMSRTLHLFAAATGRPVALPEALAGGSIVDVAFSPTAPDRLFRLSGAGEVELWQVAPSIRPLATASIAGPAWSLEVSPAGDRVAAIGGDELRIWRADDLALERVVHAHRSVDRVAWTGPDRLATAGAGGEIRFWEASTGRRLFHLTRARRTPAGVELSRDVPGARLVDAVGDDACVLTDEGAVEVRVGGREHRAEVGDVWQMRLVDGGCNLSTSKGVLRLEPSGLRALADAPDVTAWAEVHGHGLTGRATGEVIGDPPIPALEDAMAAPIAYLAPGPGDTVLVGLRSGFIGAYGVATGVRAFSRQLDGVPAGSHLVGDRLILWSDTGDEVAVDVSIFHRPAHELSIAAPSPAVTWSPP
ncbi:MAG: serine/threonine-protein kinase [bacterium]